MPKVPALAIQSEYGFAPQPYFEASCSSFEPCQAAPGGTLAVNLDAAPNPNREEDTGFNIWNAAGVDSMLVVPRASTHLIYTDSPPVLPASVNGSAMASYYVQVWLDKYLKHDPAAGAALLSPTIRYIGPERESVSGSCGRLTATTICPSISAPATSSTHPAARSSPTWISSTTAAPDLQGQSLNICVIPSSMAPAKTSRSAVVS